MKEQSVIAVLFVVLIFFIGKLMMPIDFFHDSIYPVEIC